MAFVDECTLYVASGRGGDGSVSMHSEPYKARGGPDGGSGGNGGSVILEVTAGIHDLSWLSDHPHQRATPGANGRSTSLLKLIDELNRLLGTSVKARHEAARVGDVRESLADITQARSVLGYEPRVGFEEGLRRSIDYYRTIVKK